MTIPWYERKEIKDELVIFGRAIQGVAPYRVVIEPDSAECRTGVCSFDARQICVNPTLFKATDTEQYQLTKAMLVHEAGHRRHTIPTILPPAISGIANILEDERVERRMFDEFIGVRWLIGVLAERFYQEAKPIDENSDSPYMIASYFLQLRWATRINQPVKGGLSEKNQLLWEKVEPLVYEAWHAATSQLVYRNATLIAKILDLDSYS